ncbi:hypothetical protein JKP88DRAFT_286324 [Tribonema minus]|uniref:Thioredoxin domain-containing protein n=1 Tax=Tribonema minus TaxID=303371 RepID=A0A836CKW6_9STRA|nr:hypothetical protein JKP88DRAFT_286324 [Tribonema minus]
MAARASAGLGGEGLYPRLSAVVARSASARSSPDAGAPSLIFCGRRRSIPHEEPHVPPRAPHPRVCVGLAAAAAAGCFRGLGRATTPPGLDAPPRSSGYAPPVVVLVARWCGHCRAFAPELRKLADALPEGALKVWDSEEPGAEAAMAAAGATSFPSVFVGGRRYSGPRTADAIAAAAASAAAASPGSG